MIDNEKNFYTRKYVLLQRDTGRKPKKKKKKECKVDGVWISDYDSISLLRA